MQTAIKVFTAILLFVTCSYAQEPTLVFNFSNAPIQQVMMVLEDITKTPIKVENGQYPSITLQTETRITQDEAIEAIESYCSSLGIVFTREEKQIIVSPPPRKSFYERRVLRQSMTNSTEINEIETRNSSNARNTNSTWNTKTPETEIKIE